MKKERNKHQISCLACLNLVMCGRDIQGKVHVKCVQDVLEHGRLVALDDIVDKKYGDLGCALLESVREKGAESWEQYILEIRKNFCES